MAIRFVQMAKREEVYSSNPLVITLPAPTTEGNLVIITIEGARTTDPFSASNFKNGKREILSSDITWLDCDGQGRLTIQTKNILDTISTVQLEGLTTNPDLNDLTLTLLASPNFVYTVPASGGGDPMFTDFQHAEITPGPETGKVIGSRPLMPLPVVTMNSVDSDIQMGLASASSSPLTLVNFDGDLGYWSSMYVYAAQMGPGGWQQFTVNATEYNGHPTFDHGMNVQVFEFSGTKDNENIDAAKANLTSDALANAGELTLTADGDATFLFAHCRKTAAIKPQPGYTVLDSGRVAGTGNDYYMVAFNDGTLPPTRTTVAIQAIEIWGGGNMYLTYSPNDVSFYDGVNITGTQLTLSDITTEGFTELNGRTVTAYDNDSVGVYAFAGLEDRRPAPCDGNVTGVAITLRPSGEYTPSFVNPEKYTMGVIALALKSSSGLW